MKMNLELHYVLTKVLCVQEDSPLYSAIKAMNLDDADDLLYLEKDTPLKYDAYFTNDSDPDNVITTLESVEVSELHKGKLIQLCDYFKYENTQDSDNPVEWTDLTRMRFKAYQRESLVTGTPKTVKYAKSPHVTTLTYPSTPSTGGNPTINTPTSLNNDSNITNTFRSTIKFTVKDYPTLSNDKDWRTFQRLLNAAANNHQTSEILKADEPDDPNDPNFEQSNPSCIICGMFATYITTAKGRLCVRNHEEECTKYISRPFKRIR